MPIVDCSPEAIAERKRWRAELWRSIANPAQSINDRSRSITFLPIDQRMAAIAELDRQDAFCEQGRRPSRIAHIPLRKAL